jgi:hypothetical protein
MKETDNNKTRPDRLSTALLISGFILVSLFGFYSMLTFLVAGRLPLFMLPFILLGGMGIFYGRSRTARGSSATKQLFNATRQKIQSGSLAGIAAAFLIYLVTQSKGINSSWVLSFLILAIVWAPLLGIPSGGVGGLILASIWKNKNAAFIGGAIGGALFSLYWILNFFGS